MGREFLDLGEIQDTEMILGALAARLRAAPPEAETDPAVGLLAALAADVDRDPRAGTGAARPRAGAAARRPRQRNADARRRARAAVTTGIAAVLTVTFAVAIVAASAPGARLPGPAGWLARAVRQAAGAQAPAGAAARPGNAGRAGRARQLPVALPGVWVVPATTRGAPRAQ